MKSYKVFIGLAALLGLAAVIIGALSTHVIDQGFSQDALNRIDIGLKYHVFHVMGLFGVGILASLHRNFDAVTLKLAGLFFILGLILFSGGLYAYALTDNKAFSIITPFGGFSFMLGWLFLFFFSFRK